jgi:beta-glucanase (GH16 family)
VEVARRFLAVAVVVAAAIPALLVNSQIAGSATSRTAPDCGGQQQITVGGMTLICSFDDEFNHTTELDRAKWRPQLTADSNFTTGAAPYRVCYLDNSKTISVANGDLRLSVAKTDSPFSCQAPKTAGLALHNFTSRYEGGEVTTYDTFHQTYGRFSVRALLPPTALRGLQETFWLWPQDDLAYGAFPGSGEIDFAEFYSEYRDRVIPYLHYDYKPSTTDQATNTNIVTNDYTCLLAFPRHFSLYTVDWTPGRIRLTYNHKVCLTDNYDPSNVARPAPFDQPFFIALTQALGVGANAPTSQTPLPATTLIDWVRVWRRA